MRRTSFFAVAALGVALIGGGVARAPRASAGCQPATPQVTYCDDPIKPDGTWRRCHHDSGGYRTYYGRWVLSPVVPPSTKCYLVDPSQPWPPLPILQPQYHIDG